MLYKKEREPMITNLKKTNKKDDIKLLVGILVGFIFVAWLCTPPGNKFIQMCFWGNNTKLLIAKLTNNYESTEYIFHRNNAVYLAKLYKKKDRALAEMNKAIETLPSFASGEELNRLYKERAYIRLMAGDYRGALNDFINGGVKAGNVAFNENLTIAMLFKEAGNYREAMAYCNNILNIDNTAYAGYACLSDLYSSLGRYDLSVRVWNLLIDRKKNSARAYADRALAKKKLGDIAGYNEDYKKAKEILPNIRLEDSIIEDTLHPKILTLSIRRT